MSTESCGPVGTEVPARRRGRRQEILAAFVSHVAERGFERANFGDIAAELGISKGTIVHHFRTKNQLMRELQEDYMLRRRAEAEALLAGIDRADERLAALVGAFVRYQVVDRTATIAFQREIVQLLDDDAMASVRDHRARYRHIVRDVIGDGVTHGVFRTCDPDVVSLHVFGAVHWMWTWFDPEGTTSVDDVAAEYVTMVLGGLLLDRSDLPRLGDPEGPVQRFVRDTLTSMTPDLMHESH